MNMKTFLAGMATGATVMGFVSLVVTRKSKAVDKAAADLKPAADDTVAADTEVVEPEADATTH